jgi:hypothetical protein
MAGSARRAFEQVNDVTWKLTDGEGINVPTSHGQWAGYRTTKAVAWVIEVAPGYWLARCQDQSSRPMSLKKAKARAVDMAKGSVRERKVADPVRLNETTRSSALASNRPSTWMTSNLS